LTRDPANLPASIVPGSPGSASAGTVRRWQWLLAIAVLFQALAFQGWRALYSPDEGRYTNVALNMIESGDWMRPMLHPEVEHWAKPPLSYWSIAASIEAFGRTEFAARLPGALAFGLTAILLVRIGRRAVPEQPWLPAIVYATSAFPSVASNLVTTDNLLALWETGQALAFLELWSAADERARRLWRCLLWLAAALAFMTKGPPGLLALAACILFAAIRERWAGVRRLFGWDALILFVVVGGAWYATVAAREPGIWHYFLVEEVVNRVATDKMHRNAEWYGALKVYAPTLLLGALPWWPFAIRRMLSARRGRNAPARDDATLFLRCWILLPLAVFVLARSRLPLYILPLFAPLAVVMARALAPIDFRSVRFRIALCAWCAVLLGARIVPSYMHFEDDDRALADALRREAPAIPDEVAFVEIEPRFGLRFYLNSEVERLDLPGDAPNRRAQDIGSEMLEKEGCRLLVVPEKHLDRLDSYLADHAIPYRRLPDARGFAVLAQSTLDCEAYRP
jgi:4-amino-4-deoxy-L-arabinose transferase